MQTEAVEGSRPQGKRWVFSPAGAGTAVSGLIETHEREFKTPAAARKAHAAELARDYYTLSTDFYEYGWGQSFHFAPRLKGETVRESLLRYEYYLAARLDLKPGVKALDLGCGIGGPMRNIARFSGARIVGVTISHYQALRAREFNHRARLDGLCEVVEADFNRMALDDASFDAVYEIEACCHAADRRGPFREAFRLLKPGGYLGGYDWCLTERFDPSNRQHQELKLGIEKGDAIAELVSTNELCQSLTDAGFEIVEAVDRAPTADPSTPWFQPLEANFSLRGFPNSRAGAFVTDVMVRALELTRLAPRGTVATHTMLRLAQRSLPAAGRLGIFTPNFFFLARKPQ